MGNGSATPTTKVASVLTSAADSEQLEVVVEEVDIDRESEDGVWRMTTRSPTQNPLSMRLDGLVV